MEPRKVSNTQKTISLNGRTITLLGTAHVSDESIKEVTDAIREQKPDCVAIELDEKRSRSMTDPESYRKLDIIAVLKRKEGFLLLANLVLASFQKRLGENVGVKPGDEMLAAMNTAAELGIPSVMVDRPIAVTLRRAWVKNSLWGKSKLISALIASAFDKEKISPEQIEALKKSNEMDSMMTELAEYLPAIKEVLINERDRYLASRIWEANGERVLAVLGAGHLPGVEIASALAALGTLAAGGHPITIVSAAVGAPVTSLTPVIGVGLVTGVVQAYFCKPKVSDMENLQADATSIKGWYRNRLLRVLLVFLLSTLGSSTGTFIAGADIVKSFGAFFAAH
nr:TraB/GumN family protein [Treponema socranskii]